MIDMIPVFELRGLTAPFSGDGTTREMVPILRLTYDLAEGFEVFAAVGLLWGLFKHRSGFEISRDIAGRGPFLNCSEFYIMRWG